MSGKEIKTLVIDDEEMAREGLALMLGQDPEIQILSKCKNGVEAIQDINEYRPDLIFLDVHMPGINGFEVLNNIQQDLWPFVVFITAFDDYAIKAFEYHAFDYILKPYTDNRLSETIVRVKKAIREKEHISQIQKYQKMSDKHHFGNPHEVVAFYNENTIDNNLVVKEGGNIHIIPIHEISYIEAFDYYIKIFYKNQYILARMPMKNIINKLPEKYFLRVHRSNIINIHHIESIDSKGKGDYEVILKSGKIIKVSNTYKKELFSRINKEE